LGASRKRHDSVDDTRGNGVTAVFFPFVFEDALAQAARKSDIDRMAAANYDIGKVTRAWSHHTA
jgi:hypothetical protein